MPSSRMGSYPWELKDIPERFPPLETRIGAWPTRRLVEELKKHPVNPWKRTHVLLQELLTRTDFGPADLKVLLSQVNPCLWPDSRSLVEAAAKAHRAEEFVDVIKEHFSKPGGCPR